MIGIRQRDNWNWSRRTLFLAAPKTATNWPDCSTSTAFAACSTAPATAPCACELNEKLAWRINVGGAANLLDVIGSADVRVVHLSCDLVFSGERPGGYVEEDPTDPVTVYGQTMVAGEELFKERLPNSCTLRISLPMGVSFNGHAGAIDWIQSRFKKSSRPRSTMTSFARRPTPIA